MRINEDEEVVYEVDQEWVMSQLLCFDCTLDKLCELHKDSLEARAKKEVIKLWQSVNLDK